jgi:hypothetical protein
MGQVPEEFRIRDRYNELFLSLPRSTRFAFAPTAGPDLTNPPLQFDFKNFATG